MIGMQPLQQHRDTGTPQHKAYILGRKQDKKQDQLLARSTALMDIHLLQSTWCQLFLVVFLFVLADYSIGSRFTKGLETMVLQRQEVVEDRRDI
jgi:hypothetical protein